jgi:hypothetical protein
MPALFAYLIAVALLLGGGYGALNWLCRAGAGEGGGEGKAEAPAVALRGR